MSGQPSVSWMEMAGCGAGQRCRWLVVMEVRAREVVGRKEEKKMLEGGKQGCFK